MIVQGENAWDSIEGVRDVRGAGPGFPPATVGFRG